MSDSIPAKVAISSSEYESVKKRWDSGIPFLFPTCSQGSRGDIYCLQDHKNGFMSIINITKWRAITPGFKTDNKTQIIAADTDDNGADEIYVKTEDARTDYLSSSKTTTLLSSKAFAFDLSDSDGAKNRSWKFLRPIKVPYDIDREITGISLPDDGCKGSDLWFLHEKPLDMQIIRGVLTVKDGNSAETLYQLMPGLFVEKNNTLFGKNKYTAYKISDVFAYQRMENIIDCAIKTSNPADHKQLRSALWMLRGATTLVSDQSGPYKFDNVHFSFNFKDATITVRPVRMEADHPITSLGITISQPGPDLKFNVNQRGWQYEALKIKNKEQITFNPLNHKEWAFAVDAFIHAEGRDDLTDSERKSAAGIRTILEKKTFPGWADIKP